MKLIALITALLASQLLLSQDTLYDVSQQYTDEITYRKDIDRNIVIYQSRTTYNVNTHATFGYYVDSLNTIHYLLSVTVGAVSDPQNGTGITIGLESGMKINLPTVQYYYDGSRTISGYKLTTALFEISEENYTALCLSNIYDIDLAGGPIGYMKTIHATRALNCARALWNHAHTKK